jgi:hypothetical protein
MTWLRPYLGLAAQITLGLILIKIKLKRAIITIPGKPLAVHLIRAIMVCPIIFRHQVHYIYYFYNPNNLESIQLTFSM